MVAAEGVKMCQTFCHLATLLPDHVIAISDVAKSAPSPEPAVVSVQHGVAVEYVIEPGMLEEDFIASVLVG